MSKFDRLRFSEALEQENEKSEQFKNPEFIAQMVDFIDQQYRNRSELGKGKSGEVWIGEAEILKEVCIKIIHDPSVSPNNLEREFILQDKAAKSGARIAMPIMYAEGSDDQVDSRSYQVLAMDTLKGRTLKEQIEWMQENNEQWSIEEYKRIVADIKEQVELLHKANIHHRDLHLGNLYLSEDGKIYIIDFGHATDASGVHDEGEIYRGLIRKDGKQITEVYPRDNDVINRFSKELINKDLVQKKGLDK